MNCTIKSVQHYTLPLRFQHEVEHFKIKIDSMNETRPTLEWGDIGDVNFRKRSGRYTLSADLKGAQLSHNINVVIPPGSRSWVEKKNPVNTMVLPTDFLVIFTRKRSQHSGFSSQNKDMAV